MSGASRFTMPMPEGTTIGRKGGPIGAEPFARLVETLTVPCAYCGLVCRYESASGRRPESPQFLKAAPGVWLGFVEHPASGVLGVTCGCSEECLDKILRRQVSR